MKVVMMAAVFSTSLLPHIGISGSKAASATDLVTAAVPMLKLKHFIIPTKQPMPPT